MHYSQFHSRLDNTQTALFHVASVRISRYRYRGITTPNTWTLANHA